VFLGSTLTTGTPLSKHFSSIALTTPLNPSWRSRVQIPTATRTPCIYYSRGENEISDLEPVLWGLTCSDFVLVSEFPQPCSWG
jgi:hypothetical protein